MSALRSHFYHLAKNSRSLSFYFCLHFGADLYDYQFGKQSTIQFCSYENFDELLPDNADGEKSENCLAS